MEINKNIHNQKEELFVEMHSHVFVLIHIYRQSLMEPQLQLYLVITKQESV